jgi:signal peptidase I
MECPKCGLENPASTMKCDCGFDFLSGEFQPAFASPDDTDEERRSTIWAAVLGVLTPGLGQIYNGQAVKGFAFYVAGYLLIAALGLSGLNSTSWGVIAATVILIFVRLAIIVEAPLTSRKLGTIVPKRYNRWYVYVLLIISGLLLGELVLNPLLRPLAGGITYRIPASSMEPTLLVGDHILVKKSGPGIRIPLTERRWPEIVQPRRGDVIVFVFPEDRTKDFIKRVVAVAGDTIEIRNKTVILNGQEVRHPHAHFYSNVIMPGDMNPRDNMNPATVPPGHVFVMGDNRDFSHDSRFWGFVPVEDVKGEAFLIYYSDHPSGWSRLFKLIR